METRTRTRADKSSWHETNSSKKQPQRKPLENMAARGKLKHVGQNMQAEARKVAAYRKDSAATKTRKRSRKSHDIYATPSEGKRYKIWRVFL